MKKIMMLAGLLTALPAVAMQPLADPELQAVDGQAGADFSLELKLNHDLNSNFLCANNDLQYCRLAISPNNRNDDGSVTGSATGKKIWLVMKGIQGTINIQYAGLDGTDLTDISPTKAGLALTYDAARPIQIRNYGYNALSIETDSVANEGAGNVPGYLKTGTYTTPGFDNGRELGFTGLMMNGNLAFAGVVKVFSCDSNHPRC